MEKLKVEDLEQVSGGRTSDEMLSKIQMSFYDSRDGGMSEEDFLDNVLPTMFKGGVPEDAYKYAVSLMTLSI